MSPSAPSSPAQSALLIECITHPHASDATLSADALAALTRFAVHRGEIARLHHTAQHAPGRLDRLAEATRDAAAHGASLSTWQATLTAEVWQLLNAASIPARVFKGATLAAWLHGDARVRNSCDIDLLVPADHVDAALQALAADGWTLPFGLRAAHFTPVTLAQYREVPLSNFGGTFHLDLHWRLTNAWNDAVLTEDELLLPTAAGTDAETVDVLGHTLPWFPPATLWRLALAHVVSSDWRGLRAWIDLALVSDRLGEKDWAKVSRALSEPSAAGLRAATDVAGRVLRAGFSRDVPALQTSDQATPAANARRLQRVALRAAASLVSDAPDASGWPLLTDCALALRGAARWRAATHRLLTPALDDRVDARGEWRGTLGATAAMIHRRWQTYRADD